MATISKISTPIGTSGKGFKSSSSQVPRQSANISKGYCGFNASHLSISSRHASSVRPLIFVHPPQGFLSSCLLCLSIDKYDWQGFQNGGISRRELHEDIKRCEVVSKSCSVVILNHSNLVCCTR